MNTTQNTAQNSTARPVSTTYKGYTFSKRVDVRWAIFFDALNIQWEYAPETFQLPDGSRYTPTFFLPRLEGGVYVDVQVKQGFEDNAKQIGTLVNVLLVWGEPGFSGYKLLTAQEPYEATAYFMYNYLPNSLYHNPGYEDQHTLAIAPRYFDQDVIAAIYAARNAAFTLITYDEVVCTPRPAYLAKQCRDFINRF
jgi:hypothetical protein